MEILFVVSPIHEETRIGTRTTTRSCRDPETAVSNFWSPGGVRGRAQRVPSAGSGGRRLLLLPPPPVQLHAVATGAAVHPNG